MKSERKEELEKLGLTPEQIAAVIETEDKEGEDAKIIEGSFKPVPTEVTPIVEIKKQASGNIVELPGFGSGEPWYARLRRPSLLLLMKSGKIPNSLLGQAQELFSNGTSTTSSQTAEEFSKTIEIMEVLCKASLVARTYEELEKEGIQLTDEQLMAIFAYTQRGIKALESFRN